MITSLSMPLDVDGDHISDLWDKDLTKDGFAGPPTDRDNELVSANNTKRGDGFSDYEEYRGFMVDGAWTELDPLKPDLFIEDKDSQGIQNFDGLTGLTVHLIAAADSNDGVMEPSLKGVMNANSPPETKVVDQKRLLLRKEVFGQLTLVGLDPFKKYYFGYCYPKPGVTATITEIVIYPDNIEHWVNTDPGFQSLSAAARLAMIQRVTVQTTRHELGHGVNMVHHSPENAAPYDIMAYPEPSILISQSSAYSDFDPHELVDQMQLR